MKLKVVVLLLVTVVLLTLTACQQDAGSASGTSQSTQTIPTADPSGDSAEPLVEGDVDPAQLKEMLAILNASGIKALDAFMIMDVPKDEYFAFAVGLSDDSHVVSGTSCSAAMMTTAYSLVMLQVDDVTNIETVRQDFAENLNWSKWVCVSASNALIAQKGDLVLCLMGSGSDYGYTAKAIENAGWEDIKTYKAK